MREFAIGVFVGIVGTYGMAWAHFWLGVWKHGRKILARNEAAQRRRLEWELRDPE